MQGLTPPEKRGVMVITMVIALAAVARLIDPFAITPDPVDYAASDSIFRRISAEKYTAPAAERQKKKVKSKKKELLPGSVDINRAGKDRLMQLPRIGPAIAGRILDYRVVHGKFSTLEEIKQVRGIGDKTFANIRPYLKEIEQK